MIQTYFKTLLNQLIAYLRSILVLKKKPVVVPVITPSNLDKKKLNDLILKEFTKKLLEILKKDLTQVYNELRISEQKLVPHTPEHRKLMGELHNVMEDLTKVDLELSFCINEVSASLNEIKKELKLTTNEKIKPFT